MSWEAIVAIGALALGIYNTWQARQAPAEARQRQLWDDLRTTVEPLAGALIDIKSTLSFGHELGPYPPELTYAQHRLVELGPRFSERLVHPQLVNLAAQVSRLYGPWAVCVSAQNTIDALDFEIEMAGESIASDIDVRAIRKRREEFAQQRDAQRHELKGLAQEVSGSVQSCIKYLDDRDAGRKPEVRRLIG